MLAATSRDLEAEVAAGRFRADLYHVRSRASLRAAAGVPRGEAVIIQPAQLDLHGTGERAERAAGPGEVPAQPLPAGQTLRQATRAYQRQLIEQAVALSGGNWAAAARLLGMHRSNLHGLARRLGLR